METYRFTASSVAEGLMTVKMELGDDAVILSVNEDGKRMSGAPGQVEIVAARKDGRKTPGGRPAGNAGTPNPAARSVDGVTKARQVLNLIDRKSEEKTKYLERAKILMDALEKNKTEPKTPPRRKAKTRTAAPAATQPEPASESEPESSPESERRPHLSRRPPVFRSAIASAPEAVPAEITSLYFYLVDTGISPDIAEEMVVRLSESVDVGGGIDKHRVRRFLGSLVEHQVRVGGVVKPSKKRSIVALFGPTGVGKTTTIAKLATGFARKGVSVGLVTVDHYRVGAVDQLRKYSEALNVPLLAANNRQDFVKAVRAFQTRQVVLVDTAGQNPRDYEQLDRLRQTLGMVEDIKRYLVLSAPTKERDLLGFVELYRQVGFDYLLFSKLDETATYGGLLNTYFSADRPLSYFTSGQRVPEDIEAASTGRLSELLFH